MFDTVIFDMDGTLLNTLDDIADSVNHMLVKYGFPAVSPDLVRRSMGNGAARLLHCCLPENTGDLDFDAFLSEYGAYYEIHCCDRTKPYAGIMETLSLLRENGIKMAIVSNKGDAAVNDLSALYFKGYMDCSVGEKPGIRRKPAPDVVNGALSLLEADAGTALYVGDSEVDLETARNAGISCALVSWGFRDRSVLEKLGAEYLIDTPMQLLDIVSAAP